MVLPLEKESSSSPARLQMVPITVMALYTNTTPAHSTTSNIGSSQSPPLPPPSTSSLFHFCPHPPNYQLPLPLHLGVWGYTYVHLVFICISQFREEPVHIICPFLYLVSVGLFFFFLKISSEMKKIFCQTFCKCFPFVGFLCCLGQDICFATRKFLNFISSG